MPIMSDLVSELELHLIAKLLNEDRSNAREVIKFNKLFQNT